MKMAKVVMSYDKPKEWAMQLAEHISKTFTTKPGEDFVKLVEDVVNDGNIQSDNIDERKKQIEIQNSNTQNASFMEHMKIMRQRFARSDKKLMLYTMPGSAGDVFISTGVVKALKNKFPDHFLYFATSPQFFSILRNNPDIGEVVQYEDWMSNVMLTDIIFGKTFTPNLDIQLLTSNWIKDGSGRLLPDEMAWRCDVEYQAPRIEVEKFETGLPDKYYTFHPSAANGKWSARAYAKWKDVIKLLKLDAPVVQIGMPDEPLIDGVDIDFRGKHNGYNQFAYVISKSQGNFGIDTMSIPLAAAFNIPMVAVFGSTYASKTGPWLPKNHPYCKLVETKDRMGCNRACYKDQCFINVTSSCTNNIDPVEIADAINNMIGR